MLRRILQGSVFLLVLTPVAVTQTIDQQMIAKALLEILCFDHQIADGRVRVEPLHTATASLEGIAAALADLASGTSEQTKVLVNPNW